MPVSREMVERIAALAGLALSPEEMAEQSRTLSRIIDYMERIAQVEVGGVEPLANPWLSAAPLREDEPRPTPGAEGLVERAPLRSGGWFLVPLVVDRDAHAGEGDA
jgi:aspartyl-tRNA(Asn)/glutamyl-tRNA(Gln) amidotransferase subunit C